MTPPTERRAVSAALALRLLCLATIAAAMLAIIPAARADTPSWTAYPLPRPAGSLFQQPLGFPFDLSCWSANRCILMTGGDTRSFDNGVFVFNGDKSDGSSGWRQYATVCGAKTGSSSQGQAVWAGPDELWTITQPSPPFDNRPGIALCHIVNGSVVGSYSTIRSSADSSANPYHELDSGACLSASNCWFGGVASARPDGSTPGTFHLHWDGSSLSTVYAPASRGVSDMTAFGSGLIESEFAGPNSHDVADPVLLDVPKYSPLQRIAEGAADESAFSSYTLGDAALTTPPDATEILALDDGLPSAPGPMLWAVGGGAASGPDKDQDLDYSLPGDDTPADTGPYAAWRDTGDGSWHRLSMPAGVYSENTRFVDVAAIPGTHQAIAAVMPDNFGEPSGYPSDIALLDADAGTVTPETIGSLGSVQRVECIAAGDCWAATWEGDLLRLRDATAAPVAQDTDGAFTTTITYRPNEVVEQALADSATDDSQLFAPAPVDDVTQAASTRRLKAAVRSVKSRLKGTTLVFTIRTIRKVRITVIAKRHGKVVAVARSGWIRPGTHHLSMRLNPKRWPTKITMKVSEPKSSTAACAKAPGSACSG